MSDQELSFVAKLKNKKIFLWILILTNTTLWGYAWVVMKQSLDYMGPFTFNAFRFGIGAFISLFFVWLMKVGLPPKKYWKHLVVIGFLQISVVYIFIMLAIRFVDAGKSSVLLYSMPMWGSLLAVKFLGEKLNISKTVGLGMGMIGLLTILGWDIWAGQSFEVIFGEMMIVIAAIIWAVSNTYYRKFANELPQVQVSAFQMSFGAVIIILAALFMERGEPIILNATSIYYILFSGVFASAVCFLIWFMIMSIVDMVTATISTLLVPIFGLFLSNLILGEIMTTSVVIGSLLIIFGIVISQVKWKKREAQQLSTTGEQRNVSGGE